MIRMMLYYCSKLHHIVSAVVATSCAIFLHGGHSPHVRRQSLAQIGLHSSLHLCTMVPERTNAKHEVCSQNRKLAASATNCMDPAVSWWMFKCLVDVAVAFQLTGSPLTVHVQLCMKNQLLAETLNRQALNLIMVHK